jgi:hypothetical protein
MLRVLAVVLLLAGCIKPMIKPGASPEQAAQDKRECAYEAAKAAAGIIHPVMAGVEKGRLEDQCLEVRGYRREP